MTDAAVVVIGGSSGLGMEVARHYADAGRRVVVTSRDADRANDAATAVGGETTGIVLDLVETDRIGERLAEIGPVALLVMSAIDRDENTVRSFDVARATHLTTLKLVGYAEVIHALVDRLDHDSSIVLFGGLAKSRPYPGSTTVTTVNGGITTMVHTLAVELAPIRVNALHPAIVGDSPYWKDKPAAVLEGFRSRTPLGRLVTMADVVHATVFLLENRSMTGANVNIDGGWLLM
ncbi:MAG TPA: SDR family oxidoreductase [Euzebyales bacterium]|nr:SDR family oxidoreductase [Euzebyales bacterium]